METPAATPPAPPVRTRLALGLAAGVAVAALLGVGVTAAGLALHGRAAAPAQTQDPLSADDRSSALLAGRNAVVDRFPTAVADFGVVFVRGPEAAAVVCGTVDLDEPDDAFDGPEHFIYVDGALLIEQVDGEDVLARRWRALCGQASARHPQKETVTTSWASAPSRDVV